MLQGCCLLCEKVSPDESYYVFIKNNTEDTLSLETIDTVRNVTYRSFSLYPDSITNVYGGNVGVDKGVDPVSEFLSGSWAYNNKVVISQSNKIIKVWSGPTFTGSDTINHIFNHNAWKIIKYSANEQVDGEIRFTIDEKDLD